MHGTVMTRKNLQSWKNYVKLIVNFWMQEKRSGNV